MKAIEHLEEIEIRGTKQWILSTGNEQGPILFFVHGGAGKSYSSNIFKIALTIKGLSCF